ncbi:HAD family hydrolase [Subtercola sp. RTI3]|uniref:HAD family hydrolase n=1 Tax=Subtercola sp. RTI3 TaxID=3048639 RepID=UPI002B22792F|nr:HAD family hydrolase [Subtercola sp. RTI3]MEA9984766.1 HAD family hydrolase [Subtercola sp. RTI3]
MNHEPGPRAPRAVVACDLDRTLIYSPRAFWLDTADADAPRMIVSELYEGVPISFMTRASESLLLQLRTTTEFVPVTTRTVAQYRRVRLAGPEPRYAVTTNGGVLLVDGAMDAAWSSAVRRRLAAAAAPLAEVTALLGDATTAPWIARTANAEDLFVYAIVDRDLMPEAWLDDLTAANAARGWTVSVQGRKLYCVPDCVTKGEAVAEVRRRTGTSTVLAAGDSLLDAPMLEQADLAFRPAHGELHDAGYVADNLTVTVSRGILAGEELLRLMTASTPAPTPAPHRTGAR